MDVLVMSVSNPRNSGNCSESKSHVRYHAKGKDRVMIDSLVPEVFNDLIDQPANS